MGSFLFFILCVGLSIRCQAIRCQAIRCQAIHYQAVGSVSVSLPVHTYSTYLASIRSH
jgi:hypothetical protein